MYRSLYPLTVALILAACGGESPEPQPSEAAPPAPEAVESAPLPGAGATAYTGAVIWDGTGSAPQRNMSLLVRDGRVEAIASEVPEGADVVDVSGRWIVPGIVNTHGHVSGYWADDGISDTAARVRGDLSLYARYGVTTVLSLGGAPDEALAVRNSRKDPALNYARLYMAGDIVTGDTPEAASAIALADIAKGVDWIKLRVDDNLGTTTKMPWPSVQVTMNAAKAAGLPVATHIFYMDDASRLLDMGTGLIAHSVRDRTVTDEFVQKLLDSGVCYVPTLVREVSAFVYADNPDWLDDPLFLQAAKRSEVQRVKDPAFIAQVRQSPTAAGYRKALEQAEENLRIVLGSGVPVAFGTDSGPPGRFPGYFEHLEFGLMRDAGLTSREILRSATGVAAKCIGVDDVGTLEAGKWADFVVLREDPIADIHGMRAIDDVYIAGNAVPRN